MKKKLASALVVFASVIAFAPSLAQARGSHHRGVHYSAHYAARRHHMTLSDRHRGGRRENHLARRHALRAARAGSGGRPAAWCGWWLGNQLGLRDRSLWLARNWAAVGSNAGRPEVGVVVVWRHHVGIITGRVGSQWVVKSGNDGHAVRERIRSVSGAIAFRRVA